MPWSDPWDTLWGGPAAVPELADTLYYGVDAGAGISDLATDQSQYLDNQTAAATWHYEAAPATRFNLSNEWTFEFEFEADNADTGRFFQYDCVTAASDLSMRIRATGLIDVIINNTAVSTTITLPGVSASYQRFLLAWAALPNPDTTGASDALLHFLSAWNLDTGEFDSVTFTTVVRPTQTGAMVVWAQATGGTSPFTGTPHAVRISGAFHTPTETWEEMSGQLPDPDLLGEERHGVSVPPSSTTVGDDGHFAGPAALLGAAAAKGNDLRLAGPLVNICYGSRPLLEGDLGGQNLAWLYEDPDDTDMQLYLEYTHWCPVPPACNHAHVRVFVQAVGATDLDVACYSMSQPGAFYRPDTSPLQLEKYRVTTTLVAPSHGAGGTAGEWVDLGRLRLARDNDDCTYIILGFRGSSGGTTWRVKALTVDPILYAPANGPGLGG